MQTTLAQFNETQSQDAFALQNSKLLKVRLGGGHHPGEGRIDGRLPGPGVLRARRLRRARADAEEGGHRRGHDADEDDRAAARCSSPTTPRTSISSTSRTTSSPSTGRTCSPSTPTSTGTSSGSRAAGGAMAGGLYNLELRGTGWVAILSDGPPVLLNVASAPTFADAQAAITWSSGVQSALKTDFKMKDLIGKSSGETLQLAFSGQGWVLVQPSEGQVTGAGQQRAARAGWATCSATELPLRPRRRRVPDVDDLVVGGVVHHRARTRRTTSGPAATRRRRRAAAARPGRRRARPSRRGAAARRRARGPSRSARRRSAAGARSRARETTSACSVSCLSRPLSTLGAIPSSSSCSSLKRFSPSSSAATTSRVQRSPTRASASASGEGGAWAGWRRRIAPSSLAPRLCYVATCK